MSGEALVDVTYWGMEIGKSLQLSEIGPQTAFIEIAKPMPVGTRVEVITDAGHSFTGRVIRVSEQVAGAERPPGMRIAADPLEGATKAWWEEQVSAADPAIPEPPGEPGQKETAKEAREETSGDGEAKAEQSEAEAKAPAADEGGAEAAAAPDCEPDTPDEEPAPDQESAPAEATAPKQGGRGPAKRTMVMSTEEIRAAIEAGGQAFDFGDSDDSSDEGDEGDDGSNNDPSAQGKKRKKRRRRKRKTKG